jgi:hypothetical protein
VVAAEALGEDLVCPFGQGGSPMLSNRGNLGRGLALVRVYSSSAARTSSASETSRSRAVRSSFTFSASGRLDPVALDVYGSGLMRRTVGK